MSVNSISDLIVAVAVAVIPVIGGYIAKIFASNNNVVTLVNVLSPLAKAAVTAMQKLGVTEYLEGEVKKSKAVDLVKQMLTSLGLSANDESLIKSAVEKEYAALIDSLNATYPQMTEEQAKAQEAAANRQSEVQKSDEIAKAQQALADAQAKLNELQK